MKDVVLPLATGESIESYAAARELPLAEAAVRLLDLGLRRASAVGRYTGSDKGQAAHARGNARRAAKETTSRPRAKPRPPVHSAPASPLARALAELDEDDETVREPWPDLNETDEQAERRARRMRLVWG